MSRKGFDYEYIATRVFMLLITVILIIRNELLFATAVFFLFGIHQLPSEISWWWYFKAEKEVECDKENTD
jgi:hypothetical protein